MDAQIANETAGADSRTSDPSSPATNADVTALLNKAVTRLEELSARVAEVERQVAGQRPDAEKFANEIGPIVLATKNLREEISQHKDEMKKGLDAHKKEVAATLKQVEAQIAQHRTNIANDIGQVEALVGESDQMIKEGKSLLQQSMSVYTKSTKVIEDVSLKAAKHVETTARKAGDILDEQAAGLRKELKELEEMYYRVREWLITKTLAFGLVSALIGSMAGGLMVAFYTMRQINAAAEIQQNSAKWKYLIGLQNKKTPNSGDQFDRQIEQQMEKEEGGQQDATK